MAITEFENIRLIHMYTHYGCRCGLIIQRNILNSVIHSWPCGTRLISQSMLPCSLLLHYTSEYSSPINFPIDSCASPPNLATHGRKWINGETPLPEAFNKNSEV